MSEFIRFTSKKQNYDARYIKVFVHGCLSATDVYDRTRLLEYIPDLPDDEGVLFAFWDSGSIKDMWGEMLKSMVGSISFNKIGVALGAFKAGADHLIGKKDYAREIGQAFFAELKQFMERYSSFPALTCTVIGCF